MTITLQDTATTYTINNAGILAGLLAPVVQGKGSDLKELGRRLSTLLKDQNDHPYLNIDALADDLILVVGYGKARQQKGKDLEESAAVVIGGIIARGNSIPGWAKPYVKDNGSQDPDLYSTDLGNVSLTVKPDVWSDTAVGIVGGAAKDNNLGNFKGICRQLFDICATYNKQAVVFAHHTTPVEVTDAAAGIVGPANVLIYGANDQWQPMG